MLIPPKSGRRAVRLTHATLIFEISQLYTGLVSRWLATEESSSPPLTQEASPSTPPGTKEGAEKKPRQKSDVEDQQEMEDMPAWGTGFRSEIGEVWSKAQRLRLQTQTAKWEGESATALASGLRA
jgi:hypothetical protein